VWKLARLSKCKGCEKTISKEEKYVYSNKSYCKECYDKIQIGKQEYDLLLKTICQYFNLDQPTGLIFKQIKEYKEQLGYTYGGITYCLWYIKAIEGKSFSELKYGIALVKYNYEKAKKYFEQQQKIASSVQSNIEQGEEAVNEVKVNLGKVYAKKNNFLINIGDLIGEVE